MKKEKKVDKLKFVLERKWYDLIDSGEKPQEYRKLTPFWLVRIFGVVMYNKNNEKLSEDEVMTYLNRSSKKFLSEFKPLPFNSVEFSHAYKTDRDQMLLDFKGVEIRTGREEWGAEPGVKYFVIKLGPKMAEKKRNLWHELR